MSGVSNQKATDSVTKKVLRVLIKTNGIFKLASRIIFVAIFTDSKYSSLQELLVYFDHHKLQAKHPF